MMRFLLSPEGSQFVLGSRIATQQKAEQARKCWEEGGGGGVVLLVTHATGHRK